MTVTTGIKKILLYLSLHGISITTREEVCQEVINQHSELDK